MSPGSVNSTSTVVVIGGGHSGLAMSKCLTDRSIDHVVLERGQVANSWRTDRWDSLRLLTPNWLSRLPGFSYEGDDPDGFMTMPEVIAFIDRYSRVIDAPVQTETTVTSVRPHDSGYDVVTDQGTWRCAVVVLAGGAFNVANVPATAEVLPGDIFQITAKEYRNPDQLPEGGVMVVGASATGAQLAEEIQLSGRPVTLSVGEHVRMPRIYRGKDIQWWMDAAGVLDERYDEVDDVSRARHVASPQLVGTPERRSVNLNSLRSIGVTARGKFAGVSNGQAQFSGGFRNHCALADLKMGRLLDTIDEWASEAGLDAESDAPERFEPTIVDDAPLVMDLTSGEIKTVLWATGFRPDFSWLDVPVLDHAGRLKHDGGVVDAPGMYALGSPFLRRRKSSFIHGAGDDTNELSDHLVAYLGNGAATA